ncbi:MAG TPA: ABC transporter permease [Candidatus Acidoferrales bacterium]|nr:ABC transporter permease [Candidatus Acidoferrales bacterium]
MRTIWQNVRFGLRMMGKNAVFTLVAVLTLALGIGANTAIFSVVYGVVFKPLPYANPEKLVRIYTEFPKFPGGGLRRFWVSAPEYLDMKREAHSWQTLDGWVNGVANLMGTTSPVRATESYVTGGLLDSIGASPLLGRNISPQDDAPGVPQVALISEGLWRRAFGSDPSIVGRETLVDGVKCTIIGVMRAGFQFPPGEVDPPEIWVPLQLDPANPGGRGSHYLYLLARLKPGVSLLQANDEMAQLVRYWGEGDTQKNHALSPANHPVVMFPLQDEVVRTVRPAMLMLLGAVFFVLLIACVNVANLLLARAEARQREIAVRTAIGASVGNLAKQFVTEGMLLSLAGGGLGLLLAYGGLHLIVTTNAGFIPRVSEIAVNGRVLLFTLIVCAGTGIFFGLTPLAQVVTRNLSDSLKASELRSTATSVAQWFRRSLVVMEMALALVLLVGSGLMVRGFWKLLQVNPGFVSSGLLTMRASLVQALYPNTQSALQFWIRAQERLSALPGVKGVTMMSGLPPARRLNANDTEIEGLPKGPDSPIQNVDYWQFVGDRYFETMGIPLIEGRFFDQRDGGGSPPAAIVNQAMARHFWGKESPVGRRVRPGGPNTPWFTVIGVVADVKNAGLDQPAGTELYFAVRQMDTFGFGLRSPNFVLRTSGDPGSLAGAARQAIAGIDPALPLANVRTMDEVLATAQSRPRFLTLLLGLFSSVALALAGVGIYGLMSYSVTQRTNEIGIRMALGAQPSDVLRLIVGHGMRLTLLGLLIGIAVAIGLTRTLASLWFGISATDPLTFATITVILAGVALLACFVPARRAMRVDPIVALRYE